MAEYDVYVVGMRKEIFVDMGPGSDYFMCDDEPIENEMYVLFCVTCKGRVKFTIDLSESYGWCGSGYTTASWGQMRFTLVNSFGPATHMPKERKIKIKGAKYDASRTSIDECLRFESVDDELDEYEENDVITNVFSFSSDGGDGYYPRGHVHVREELFNKLSRAFDKMPVWILNGTSGTGKSTFGYILEEYGKTVYETDSANNGKLPDEIWADVIVVGNKWKNVTVEEVEKHLPENCKAVSVKFSF